MRLEQMKYIIEVAHCKSIALASERLFISPPALSMAISTLEKELNLKIFHRTSQGMIPTIKGASAIESAQAILFHVDQLQQLGSKHNQMTGEMHITTFPAICNNLMPALQIHCKKSYPEITLHFYEKPAPQIIDFLCTQQATLGITGVMEKNLPRFLARTKQHHFSFEPLYEDQLFVYVGKNHPLTKQATVQLEDICQYPLVAFNGHIIEDLFLPFYTNYQTQVTTLDVCDREVISRMLTDHHSVSILPQSFVYNGIYLSSGAIVQLDIAPLCHTLTHMLVYSNQKPLSRLEQTIIHELKQVYKNFLPQK